LGDGLEGHRPHGPRLYSKGDGYYGFSEKGRKADQAGYSEVLRGDPRG
jgi:hypothetical protein